MMNVRPAHNPTCGIVPVNPAAEAESIKTPASSFDAVKADVTVRTFGVYVTGPSKPEPGSWMMP